MVSRHPDRPYTLDYVEAITDGNFLELHGDRTVKDDKAMVGGFGELDGRPLCLLVNKKAQILKCASTETLGWQILKDIEGFEAYEACREIQQTSSNLD